LGKDRVCGKITPIILLKRILGKWIVVI